MPRYIDAESFRTWILKQHRLSKNYTVQMLDETPTADVQEVRHGHWVWDKDGMDWGIGAWVCSACHTRAQMQWSMISRNPQHFSGHQYCSVCGAKMDEKENE